MRIAITGATGFVGRELTSHLKKMGHFVVPVVRQSSGLEAELVIGPLERIDVVQVATSLKDVDAVAHLAARTHVLRENGEVASNYRRVNVIGTERLLQAVTAAQVRRFVYMSSIKVNGEETLPDQKFSGDDVAAPEDDYGRTKFEAESVIRSVTTRSDLEAVILRPPLVYGAHVQGNFGRLVAAVRRGIPLPLKSIDNRRSLISVFNLADATAQALLMPRTGSVTLTLSDGEDVSTRLLVESIGNAIGRSPRLFSVPPKVLRKIGQLVGRGDEVRRLVSNLQVDCSAARRVLDWSPQEELGPALCRMLNEERG